MQTSASWMAPRSLRPPTIRVYARPGDVHSSAGGTRRRSGSATRTACTGSLRFPGLRAATRSVERGRRDFGGFDAVVLWHAYPVIGIDERNQFDFYRDVPGLNAVVRDLQRLGLRVFVDYNPWDFGTRREPVDDRQALVRLLEESGADGVFLDTLREADAP